MSLKRNTVWNLAGTGLPLLLGAVTIPYLLKNIGIEAFGILTLIWALIGYFSLFDFGLGRALTQQVSAARGSEKYSKLPTLVKTGLCFTVVTGVLGGILLALLAQPLALHWLKISILLQPSSVQALLIASVGIPLTTLTTGLRGVLEGFEDFKGVNLLRICLGVANFALPALSVMFVGHSLVWMVGGLIIARLIVLLAHVWLVHLKMPKGWTVAKFSRQDMQALLSFGIWMMVSNIISPLMVTADRFIISGMLGATVVAYYTIPFEFLIRVLVVPGALTAALFPRLALVLIKDIPEADRLYRSSIKIILLILVPTCLAIALGSKWGMTLWLGADFSEHSWGIVVVMAIGLIFNGVAHVPFAAIQAKGYAHTTAKLHILELIFYIPLLFVCLKYFGLMGAALAWTFRVIFDLFALLHLGRKVFRQEI